MDNSIYIGALFVAAQVHLDFAGRAQALCTFQHIALCINAQQLVRRDEALAHARRRCKESSVLQPNRDITIIGSDPAKLPHFMADIADLVFDFFDLHSLYLLKWILSFTCIILLQFALVFAYNDIILDDIDILGDACHEVSGFP